MIKHKKNQRRQQQENGESIALATHITCPGEPSPLMLYNPSFVLEQ
jgi:hypothetical protein